MENFMKNMHYFKNIQLFALKVNQCRILKVKFDIFVPPETEGVYLEYDENDFNKKLRDLTQGRITELD